MSADKPEFKMAPYRWGISCITCRHHVLLHHALPVILCCNRDDSEVPKTAEINTWMKDRQVSGDFICEHYRHEYMSQELHDRLMAVLREYWNSGLIIRAQEVEGEKKS